MVIENKVYTVSNQYISLSAMNFGASITAIKTVDKDGRFENILVSFENPADFVTNTGAHLGAMVGPVAGRIANGTYTLDGKTYRLSQNDYPNHLHGGDSGISMQYFECEEIVGRDRIGLHFYGTFDHSKDGLEGEYRYDVRYELINNTLQARYMCTPSKRAIVNMTNHMYFNLGGDLTYSIEKHHLTIPSTQKLKIHQDRYPYSVEDIEAGSAFDFLNGEMIRNNLKKGSDEFAITRALDTPFLLNKGNTIVLYDQRSQRKVEIETDQKSVVVYSANYFDESMVLNKSQTGYPLCAIALETQDVPNGINIEGIKTEVYDSDHPYIQHTTYTFTTA